jgi:hypothetical protein
MLTLNALRADMEASGRYLSLRKARDWWTKGLLPRPERRGLGRGRGTETYWTDGRVLRQARAAYDLLALHRRADFALLSLWLLGFPMSLRSVRGVYRKFINRHLRSVHGRRGERPEDVVGRLAGLLARRQMNKDARPADARNAFTDLAVEGLGIFYEVDGEFVSDGLAELWQKAVPSVAPLSSSSGLEELHPRDEDLVKWARYLKGMGSLKAQLETIGSATDYELIRARRLVLFVFGYLRRVVRAAPPPVNDSEELGRRLLIGLGQLAVPILVAVLRRQALRRWVVSSLLGFALTLPRRTEWAAALASAREHQALMLPLADRRE